MTTKTKAKWDNRFPMPTKETQDEWSAYIQRADEVAYRLLSQTQEHEIDVALGRYDVPFNPETDHG